MRQLREACPAHMHMPREGAGKGCRLRLALLAWTGPVLAAGLLVMQTRVMYRALRLLPQRAGWRLCREGRQRGATFCRAGVLHREWQAYVLARSRGHAG